MEALHPTLEIHRADERGGGTHGWLTTHYSFSFAHWYHPYRMGFGALRVLNDDLIAAQHGFDTHSHDNMEIVTIVTEGQLTHEDSMGNKGSLVAGEVQVMSAGTGVHHSECNETDAPLTLFQIWIIPATRDVSPRYDQRVIARTEHGATLLVAPMGHEDALTIHQDAYMTDIAVDAAHSFEYAWHDATHGVYFFVLEGDATVGSTSLAARDAVGVQGVSTISIITHTKARILAIEVPMTA